MARKAATAVKEAVAAEPAPSIMAIKAFDADLRCSPNGKPFQFEIGGTYKIEGKVTCCENGFHAVDPANPLHVWDYYPPIGEDGRLTRYADVVMTGATDKQVSERGTKIAAAEITIKAEITLPDFIKRAVTAIIDAAKGNKETAASGDSATLAASGNYATLAASGNYATLAASGDSATLAASGNYAKLAASGDSAKLAASGNYATLAASGDSAKLAASGNYATLAASGDSATLAASGNSAKLAASGNSAKLAASGKDSVIAASAPGCIASGAEGTWISLAEFRDGKCVGFCDGYVGTLPDNDPRKGKDGLKPDTAYRARDGKLVEVA